MPTVAVIEKALTIIRYLEGTKEGIGLTQISTQTEINKTSCYRILQTLMLDNIVEYGEIRGTYRLGLRLLKLGDSVKQRIDVRNIALPYMKELTDNTDDTTYLCILSEEKSLCVERVEGKHVQILLLNVGDVWPLYIGAAPRAILSFQKSEKIDEILSQVNAKDEMNEYTYVTDVNYKKLIEETKSNGYSVSYEDVISGVSSIGAPIFNYLGEVIASISISSTSKKISHHTEFEFAQKVVATANKISKELGWTGP